MVETPTRLPTVKGEFCAADSGACPVISNYLGELLMAVGLTLSLGYPWMILPWLYPLYYVVLLGTRERDDDKRCSEKYGELWEQYRQESALAHHTAHLLNEIPLDLAL